MQHPSTNRRQIPVCGPSVLNSMRTTNANGAGLHYGLQPALGTAVDLYRHKLPPVVDCVALRARRGSRDRTILQWRSPKNGNIRGSTAQNGELGRWRGNRMRENPLLAAFS